MPVSLGGPDILVGNITDGKLVIKDIQYVPTTQLTSTTPSSGPAPIIQPPVLTPINPAINLNTPAVANERLVLFNRQTNEYLSTTPELAKEAIAKNPNIEFIAAFDSATADIVAKTLAENPPGNIDQMIMSEGGKSDIAGNMQVLAFLNALIVSLGNRGGILSELLSSGRISPELNIYQMYDLAKGINDFENIYVPDAPEVVVTQPPIRTTKAIGEEAPPSTVVPSPITTLALGEEAPPQPNKDILEKVAKRQKLLNDLEAADRIMDVNYCSDNRGSIYFGRNDVNTYYMAGGRGIPATNETCRIGARNRGNDFGGQYAIAISKEDYKKGLRRQIAELDAELVSTRPPFSQPRPPSGPVNPWQLPMIEGLPQIVRPPISSQPSIPSNCVKVPPGVPPVPAGCVPVRPPLPPPLPPQIRPEIIRPPVRPPAREKYDDTGRGTGTI